MLTWFAKWWNKRFLKPSCSYSGLCTPEGKLAIITNYNIAFFSSLENELLKQEHISPSRTGISSVSFHLHRGSFAQLPFTYLFTGMYHCTVLKTKSADEVFLAGALSRRQTLQGVLYEFTTSNWDGQEINRPLNAGGGGIYRVVFLDEPWPGVPRCWSQTAVAVSLGTRVPKPPSLWKFRVGLVGRTGAVQFWRRATAVPLTGPSVLAELG